MFSVRVRNGDFEALRLMKQGRHVTCTPTSSNQATSSTPKSHLKPLPSSPDQLLANRSLLKQELCYSPARKGTKRHLPYVDIDFDDDRIPAKIKPEVVDLCDSQDDALLAPLDISSAPNIDIHKTDRKPVSTHTTNQNAQKVVNQDEEAKIVSIREVMPDAELGDILSALSSCRGNVDLAVATLLDSN